MKYYFGNDENEVQVGIDEAGRGCFAGPVFAAAVIWDKNKQDEMTNQIKDSKKLSKKEMNYENIMKKMQLQQCSKPDKMISKK